MSISPDDVLKVAKLAKLQFTQDELSPLAQQLSKIVDFVETLTPINTDRVEPLAHAMDLHSVLRDDAAKIGLSRNAALANSPQHDDECFRVPPVI